MKKKKKSEKKLLKRNKNFLDIFRFFTEANMETFKRHLSFSYHFEEGSTFQTDKSINDFLDYC